MPDSVRRILTSRSAGYGAVLSGQAGQDQSDLSRKAATAANAAGFACGGRGDRRAGHLSRRKFVPAPASLRDTRCCSSTSDRSTAPALDHPWIAEGDGSRSIPDRLRRFSIRSRRPLRLVAKAGRVGGHCARPGTVLEPYVSGSYAGTAARRRRHRRRDPAREFIAMQTSPEMRANVRACVLVRSGAGNSE